MNRLKHTSKLQKYLEEHIYPHDPVLSDLYRQTNLKAVHPQMLSGPVQGKFLEMISKMIQPMNILEIGTYTGYSAICLARGLKPGGKLYTIEVNDELFELNQKYFKKAGLKDRIELLNGNALDLLPRINKSFDLIFIDADKDHYPAYYKLCRKKLKNGGYLIADNVLWDGKVSQSVEKTDTTTRAIIEFNEMIQQDPEMENYILPLRDGLMIAHRFEPKIPK